MNLEDDYLNLSDFISYSRRQLLDLVEVCCEDAETWQIARRRILQLFGNSGFGRFLPPREFGGVPSENEFH